MQALSLTGLRGRVRAVEEAETGDNAPAVERRSARTRVGALLPHLVVLCASFFVLSALPAPRTLTADEVDTLRGGRHLVDLMTTSSHDPRLEWGDSLRGRLRAGFATIDNPRFTALPDSAPRRAVVEAPLPRWLAAFGIGVLPVSDEATNLERASVAASLALALALALLTWSRRKLGLVQLGFIVAAAFSLPGFFDAGASAGYAAASVLAMTLFITATERLLDTGRGAIWVGLTLGLCLGVHPLHLALVAVVFIAWAVKRLATTDGPRHGGLVRLPPAPLSIFAVPVAALAALILLWPALWNDTGNRLGAWIADFGSLDSPPIEVAGLAWDQAAFRTSQAWTALLQGMTLVPAPILLLWALGLGRAIIRGRDGRWLPIVALVTIVLVAGLDGGLFGARLSLIEALWVPTLCTAAEGFHAISDWVVRRWSTRRPAIAPVVPWVLGAFLLLVPLFQAARGMGAPLAGHFGLEARYGLPLALLQRAEELEPNGSVHVRPLPAWYKPTLEVLWRDCGSSLDWGTESAALLVTIGEPPADLAPRLIEELGRVERSKATLWRLGPATRAP
jgi:hypothetical protein